VKIASFVDKTNGSIAGTGLNQRITLVVMSLEAYPALSLEANSG